MPEVFHSYASFGMQQRTTMRFEADVFECEVVGEIPAELQGAYYRLGGDRQYPSLEDDIVLNGDGMVSAFWFEDGHVSFRSRYVQTERLKAERAARRRLYGLYRNRYTDDASVSNLPGRDNTGNTFAFRPPRRTVRAARGLSPLSARPRYAGNAGRRAMGRPYAPPRLPRIPRSIR